MSSAQDVRDFFRAPWSTKRNAQRATAVRGSTELDVVRRRRASGCAQEKSFESGSDLKRCSLETGA